MEQSQPGLQQHEHHPQHQQGLTGRRGRPPREPGPSSGTDPASQTSAAPLTGHAQPHPPRQSRRSKFKATLTAAPQAQTSSGSQQEIPASAKRNRKPKRARVPPGDDLTSTLTHALRTPPYPDCSICFNPIRPEQPTWSCNPSTEAHAEDDKDGSHCCWNTFHLKCIRSWAEKSVQDIDKAWRARGESRPGEWLCPGCRATRQEVPRTYMCFCLRMRNPLPPRIATPHSCAQPCSRPRSGCTHACPLPCHPGPCPPCAVTVQVTCFCGNETHSAKCQIGVGALSFSCTKPCSKPLLCGNPEHRCLVMCHAGPCLPCPEREEVRCWCGRETKRVVCGGGKVEDGTKCVVEDAGSEQVWIGSYGCGQPCQRPFACSNHVCSKLCHPPSPSPPPCPFHPARIVSCACGRCRIAHSPDKFADTSTRSSADLPPRSSCTSPLPTCTSPCSKILPCRHLCKATCHWDPCPSCTEPVERTCRCGGTKHKTFCGESAILMPGASASQEIICDKPCPALLACGRHQCFRICCPLASISTIQRAKGKKRHNPTLADAAFEELGTEERGLHECDLPCHRVMGCGNHRCPRRDHKGTCGVCLRSVFEELICPCGRTVFEPPLSCGTRLDCTYPCARPPPLCGHPHVPHACHEGVVIAGADTADEGLRLGSEDTEGTRACPPCPFLTSKLCACGKKNVVNVRCSQERVSCGSVCGNLLACGFHHCERLCHADACGTCSAVCGKSRKSCLPARHPCTQTCHAPASCPETEPCLTPVTLTCPCGNLRSTIPCSGTKLSLACSGECEIKKRNVRLAEALGIGEEKRDAKGKVTWSAELVSFARGLGNSKFVGLVEKAFSGFVTSDRRTQVLPHMPPDRRKFVHDLASVYRMDTVMVDQEPHRSVQLIRRIDTRIPTPLLSQHVASTGPSFGRLVDLRSATPVKGGDPVWGPGSTGIGTGAGAGSNSGGRRWNTVAKSALAPKSGNSTPERVPSPAHGTGSGEAVKAADMPPGPSRFPGPGALSDVNTGTSTSAGTAITASAGTKGAVWVSPSVQAQRAREATAAAREEDVPDDWEDDA